ncbi:DUF397 domain-containing protein [Actinomadura keratinilytica]|uniref:DUF397 domain-containing protein n=1 Tax=Actinomadura keratinilytica TaxID=547461 RepID=UPI003621D2B1
MTEQQPVLSDGVIIEFIDGKDVPVDHKDFGDRAVVMRDAKNPDGPILYFTEAEWDAFIAGVKDGEFDDLLEEEPRRSRPRPRRSARCGCRPAGRTARSAPGRRRRRRR